MELFRVEIPKSKLSLVPENEKIFFVQLGNLLNDLNILQKAMLFSADTKTTDKVVRSAQNSQALFFARILAGKLCEGWQLLQKDFFTTKVSKEYEKELSESEKNCIEQLKKYFGKKNLIYLIRNEFAFHYSSEQIKELINEVPDSEIFEIFVADAHGNCFYSISHILVNFAILKSTGLSDIRKAMDQLLREINQITRWFGEFLGGCLFVFAKKHSEFKSTQVEISDPPNISDVTLPYFVRNKPHAKRKDR